MLLDSGLAEGHVVALRTRILDPLVFGFLVQFQRIGSRRLVITLVARIRDAQMAGFPVLAQRGFLRRHVGTVVTGPGHSLVSGLLVGAQMAGQRRHIVALVTRNDIYFSIEILSPHLFFWSTLLYSLPIPNTGDVKNLEFIFLRQH